MEWQQDLRYGTGTPAVISINDVNADMASWPEGGALSAEASFKGKDKYTGLGLADRLMMMLAAPCIGVALGSCSGKLMPGYI